MSRIRTILIVVVAIAAAALSAAAAEARPDAPATISACSPCTSDFGSGGTPIGGAGGSAPDPGTSDAFLPPDPIGGAGGSAPDESSQPGNDQPAHDTHPTHDAVLPTVCFAGDKLRVLEGDSGERQYTIEVVLDEPSNLRVEVEWYDTAAGGDGDYRAEGGVLVFEPGETRKTITITVLGDKTVESDESYGISLRNAHNAERCMAPGVRLEVVNDDPVAAGGTPTSDAGSPPPPLGGPVPPTPPGAHPQERGSARLAIRRTRRVTKDGRFRLRVPCASGGTTCDGVMKLVAGPVTVARAHVSIASGDSELVDFRLGKRMRRTLVRHDQIELTLFSGPGINPPAGPAGGTSMVGAGLLLYEVCVKAPDRPFSELSPAMAAMAIYCLINQERAKKNLPPLKWNWQLYNAAKGHAVDADRIEWWCNGCDTHINPQTSTDPGQRIAAAGYCAAASGENNAWGYRTPRDAVAGWMNSPGHRANILNEKYDFTEFAVAVVPGSAVAGGGGPTIVSTFGIPC